jgi:glyoxylase-like metal-dependent hydrolase (beta-lactamase superfamily II)/ferredoxin
VDSTCIDCGTCYHFLPQVFQGVEEHSRVRRQPQGPWEKHRARMALLACPTGSIGTEGRERMGEARAAFPDPLEDEVFFCGFTSEKSFGAWSYFVRRPEGNLIMDSPRALPSLLDRLEEMGGVDLMVLSHRDDVADHQRIHDRFQCARIMAREDLEPSTAPVERPVDGLEPVPLAPDLLFIPTPGHTPGSACLLYREKFLFSGDHLMWDRARKELTASREHCWFDWPTQIRSLERLLDFSFTWVLPGHGMGHRAEDPQAMRQELEAAIARLKGLR